MTDIKLLPLPAWMERYTVPIWGPETDKEQSLDELLHRYARANVSHATAAKDAEIERLRAERDSFQRVGIAAQARTDRLAEALRRQRGWWLASKGEAVSNAPGGLTRIDPGFIALCDAHVQQIDLALRDHDQEVGNG